MNAYAYSAIGQALRNGQPNSALNPGKCQNWRLPAIATPTIDCVSNNSRWCTVNSSSYCVSEDGCLIAGELGSNTDVADVPQQRRETAPRSTDRHRERDWFAEFGWR